MHKKTNKIKAIQRNKHPSTFHYRFPKWYLCHENSCRWMAIRNKCTAKAHESAQKISQPNPLAAPALGPICRFFARAHFPTHKAGGRGGVPTARGWAKRVGSACFLGIRTGGAYFLGASRLAAFLACLIHVLRGMTSPVSVSVTSDTTPSIRKVLNDLAVRQ